MLFIPARGGSKGIPCKSLVDLCGKPLIAWSVETGHEFVRRGAVARAIVSTENVGRSSGRRREIATFRRVDALERPWVCHPGPGD